MERIVPKQVRYQTAPRPEPQNSLGCAPFSDAAQEHKTGPNCGFGVNLRHHSDTAPGTAVPEPFVSPYLRQPTRSLEQYLDELCAQLTRLPLTSPKRGDLISRIRRVEDEIGWAEGQ